MSHKYSDKCQCQKCNDAFYREVLKALKRGDDQKRKRKK